MKSRTSTLCHKSGGVKGERKRKRIREEKRERNREKNEGTPECFEREKKRELS